MAWTVEWKIPPASAFKSDRELLEDDLRECPGRWARVQRDMKSKTAYSSWRKAGFEAVTAPAESAPDRWDVYARAPGIWPPGDPEPEKAPTPAKAKGRAPRKTANTSARAKSPTTAPEPVDAAAEDEESADLAPLGEERSGQCRRCGRRNVLVRDDMCRLCRLNPVKGASRG